MLLRLARDPPRDAGVLADVPGVGPAVAQAYGATILGALGVDSVTGRAPRSGRSAAELALEEWRAAVAREMGVPSYVVLGDRALAQLAAGALEGARPAVAIGPRMRAKFAGELQRVLERVRRSTGGE